MSITRDFKLSLVAGRSVPLVINANQYDDGEIWRFTLLDENGQKYSPSTGSIIGLKSDGHIIANAGTVSSTGLVIIPETEQMTASPGKNFYELLIDDDTHGTANFIVFVEPRPGAGGTPSDSDLDIFQEAIDAAATIGDVVDLVDDVAVLEARMDEFARLPDGSLSTAADAELVDIRVGADGTTYTTAGDAVRGQYSDLKNELNNILESTTRTYQHGNIYDIATNKINGKYYYRNVSNELTEGINASFSGFIIKVIPNNTYTAGVNVFGVLLDANKSPINQTGSGYDFSNVSTFVSGNAKYCAISYKPSDVTGEFVISQGSSTSDDPYSESYENIITTDDNFSAISTNPLANNIITKQLEKIQSFKTPYGSAKGTLANGEYLEISGRSALKDGEKIIFKGFLSSFGSLRLAFMYAGGVSNYIDVDATNITIKNNSSTPSPVAHGLTISHDITIIVEFIQGNAKISVISNGALYITTVQWIQISGVASSPRVISTNTTCTSAELRTVYNAVKRKVWYFGDSYISFNDSRKWVYYLKEYDFDKNVLLSGSSGCSSAITRTALEALLNYGNPNIAVMGTGMNDGNDSGNTPASIWSTNRDYFISNCESANAEPVFCTIPTVPSVNNEAKNAWIRTSGYRYIDFAKAVGADGTGAWYEGMLASDNVHPTEEGAKALFSQVLIDLPEVMLN